MSSPKRESVTVLEECIDLQKRKSQDYQNPNSNIVQAMHYRRGVSTIHDMISQKLLRAQSLLEASENNTALEPNFESLEDTYKDLINYASFAVSYLRGKMEGQDPSRDMLNRPIVHEGMGQIHLGDVDVTVSYDPHPPGEVIKTVEQDGFVTVVPNLNKTLDDSLLTNSSIKSVDFRIAKAYVKSVYPKGPIEVPEGEELVNDTVIATYKTSIPKRKRKLGPQDIGDRMDGDFDELAKKKSER